LEFIQTQMELRTDELFNARVEVDRLKQEYQDEREKHKKCVKDLGTSNVKCNQAIQDCELYKSKSTEA